MNELQVGDIFHDYTSNRTGHELEFRVRRFIGVPITKDELGDDNELLNNGYRIGDIIGERVNGIGGGAFKPENIRKKTYRNRLY